MELKEAGRAYSTFFAVRAALVSDIAKLASTSSALT